jgi:Flp pilus assembly protein TadD
VRSQGAVLGTIALLRAGNVKEAEEFLDLICSKKATAPAAIEYLTAYLRVAQGRRREARTRLAQCIRLDPAYAAEARLNPALAPLLSGLQGTDGGYA